ncbi:kinase-like domain-containing protein, partial [Gigaspora rosea]
VKNQHKNGGDSAITIYGITKNPKDDNYMMVMQYANQGSLRKLLNNKYNELDWTSKIIILYNIAYRLNTIHQAKLVHKNFHSGNIVSENMYISYYRFGLCKQVSRDLSSDEIYGILPYIDPVVLCRREKAYTEKSDIYSFGVIMSEIFTGYYNIPHNDTLATFIYFGLRPKIRCKVPQLLLDLMSKCLDAEPQNRPTANKIANTLNQFCQDLNDEKTELCNQVKQIKNSSKNSSKYDQMKSERLNYKTDPQAIYTSRLLHFPTLPKQLDKPINAWVDGFDITYDDFIEYFYQNRMEVEKNKQKAFKYFQKYAEMWLASGAYSVGRCYAEGIGIEKNNQKAFKYFQKSAEMGHTSGTYSIECHYYEGIGVEKNEKKAFEYYLKSAEMGNADGKNVIKNKYQII